MKVLFVRHALAMDKKKFAQTKKKDSERPLTAKGLKDINRVGKILKKIIVNEVDKIYSSPYLRALQTAEVLGKIYKREVETVDFLSPEADPGEMISFIKRLPDDCVLFMVGHNPSMGNLIGRLVTNKNIPIVSLKKAGVAIVDVEKKGSTIVKAELIWVLQPDVLIRLYFG
ncbi:MAG: phosphohistidine phosphatase SixA [Deltaproteobacteria bacterium]|nr:phosphohistidine phosphatase SixA [Deltaproteobacteria bacterium]